jgi:uncharacterized membrane protein
LIRIALTVAFSLLFTRCGNYRENSEESVGVVSGNNNTFGYTALSFEAVKAIVLDRHCYRCHSNEHGNQGHINLETYHNTFAARLDIRTDVAKDSMPKHGAPVDDYAKKVLFTWLSANAPEVSHIPLPDIESKPANPANPEPPFEPSLPPLNKHPDFIDVTTQILQPHCLRCHREYVDYDRVAKEAEKIRSSITSGRMPKRRPPLPIELQNLMADWIRNRMPEHATND